MTAVGAARRRALSALATVPTWGWLAALVAVSSVIRFQLGRSVAAPWIMVDEIVYSELAKSLAATGSYLVRDQAAGAHGIVYPLLLAPAYRAFTAVPDVYAAAKAINAVVMSLAALPVYAIARRLVSHAWALAAAALALALPALAYTGMLMTENAFYPVFLLAVLALVRMLERPTSQRQLELLAACVLALLVRFQALALIPAALSAPLLLRMLQREGRRGPGRYRTLYVGTAALAAAAVLVQVVRGRPLGELLGAYRAVVDVDYHPAAVVRWIVFHAAGLELAVAVAPAVAFVLLAVAAPRLDPPVRVFVAAVGAATFWLVVEVGAFASQPSVERIQERNIFYLAPLLVLALVVWIDRGAPRPPRVTAAIAVVAVALPALLPFGRLLAPAAVADTFSLLPWWWVQDNVAGTHAIRAAVSGAAAAAAAATALLHRQLLSLLPLLVLGWFAIATAIVLDGVHGVLNASADARAAGIGRAEANWIDRAVGADADVAMIWTGRLARYTVWENEFFNRSVRRVYDLSVPLPGGLPETPVSVDPRTRDLVVAGAPLRARYLLSDGSLAVDGTVVARDDRIGLSLFRVDGPVRARSTVTGLYPGDVWSAGRVAYTRFRCSGGTLAVTVASDPALFRAPQVVRVLVGGETVARVALRPAGSRTLRMPLRTDRRGACEAVFSVSPTAVPARVLGGGDDRELGARFLRFVYTG